VALWLVAAQIGAEVAPQVAAAAPELDADLALRAALLMSTGLTFGTIASLYGLNAGIIDQTQFSVLVTVVVLTAILPTIVAQRWFTPPETEGR
jgi:Kef-type K+ transport system membrane component KefB